nr:transcription factor MYB44-like [Ipomoea batatas]
MMSQKKDVDRIRGPWSPEEDELLTRLVEKHGARNWSLISKSIPGRSGKSCRLRWCNQLSPQSPSGSDLSDSSLPQVFRPVARTGGVFPTPVTQIETDSDPPTSLTLSLPGSDSSETPTSQLDSPHIVQPHAPPPPPPPPPISFSPVVAQSPSQPPPPQTAEKPLFSPEFLAVLQDMIRKEVRTYMSGVEKNGLCMPTEAIRNAIVKRISLSRIE